MEFTSLILWLYIFGIYSVLTFAAECGQSEYLSTAGECCPMCNIGSVVLKDCSGDYSTTCKPCFKGTYMNEPNGVDKCLQCKVCDRGLSILQHCTTIQNTVCEVLDGYYCSDYSDIECIYAVEHSKCTPGQHIKTPGTKTSDTVCEPCPSGFYSTEGVNCTKWTDCSANNEVEDQEGTSITDVKCKPRMRYVLIGFAAALILLLATLLFLCRQAVKDTSRRPVEETDPHSQTGASSSSSSKQKKYDKTDSEAVTSVNLKKEYLVVVS